MDMKFYMQQSKSLQSARDEHRETLRAESIERRLKSVIWYFESSVSNYTPLWFQRKKDEVSQSIWSFFMDGVDGEPLTKYIEEGKIKVKYGNFTQDFSIAKKSFGAYMLSLESPIGPAEASKFSKVLIITVMADHNLSNFLKAKLGVGISSFKCNRLLNEEKNQELEIKFVPIKTFKRKIGNTVEPIELGKREEVVGNETVINVFALGYAREGIAYITRTDWFNSEGLPKPYNFNLSYKFSPS